MRALRASGLALATVVIAFLVFFGLCRIACGAEKTVRYWACKKRGGQVFCHVFPQGAKAMKMYEMDGATSPDRWTPPNPWRDDEITPALVTAA